MATRTPRTPSRDVEVALLDAAEAVLVRQGPEAVTVRAVATEAGVAPMGVYNRFGSKEGLVDALLLRGFLGLRAAIAGRGEAGPLDRLRGAGARYREFALAHPAHYAAMFEGALGGPTDSEEVHLAAGAAFGELVGHVRACMDAGLVPDGDADNVAQQVWSTVHGAVALELKGLVLTPDPASTYLALLELLVRGLTTPVTTAPAAGSSPSSRRGRR